MEQLPTWPFFGEDEREAAGRTLSSAAVNYWTGTEGRAFERDYAERLKVKHAIALMNGTVSLELALRMWGLGKGDEVVVTPRSFIASSSCVVLQGAKPVFADIDPVSGNITAASIEKVLSARTKAIIPVHLGGWPCEMDDIMALANAHGIRVLEDCAQAHGAKYKGREVGAIGHASSFSFCQDKIITTGGEGGLLVTDDEELWARAWAFKDHGKSFDGVYRREHPPGFRWVHDSFGTNWRMTEFQAAIGRVQLRRLDEWGDRRRLNASILMEELQGVSAVSIPIPPSHLRHAYYRFYCYLVPEALRSGWSRNRIVSEIAARGAPCFSGSCSEIYRERAFEGQDFALAQRLPGARQLGETSIALLVHPTLSSDHMRTVAGIVRDVLIQATR